MELTSQLTAPRVSLVCVHDPRVRWCVRASHVVRIIAASEWSGRTLDMVAALDYPTARAEARRLVVVRAGDRELALIAAGPIDIADIEPDAVLALPDAFARSAAQVAGIIVAADASLSLLLEPSAVTVPEDSVFGEELCPRHS